jgi:Acyl-CoA dehydrogenase, C-terminal domain
VSLDAGALDEWIGDRLPGRGTPLRATRMGQGTALQIHGSLGYTMDTPLAAWYAEVRMQHLVDGPDEVHRWRIGRNVLAAQRTSGTTAAAAGGDLF